MKFENKWFTLVIGILLGFSVLQGAPLLLAQDTTPAVQPPAPVSAENQACVNQLSPYFMEQRQQFLDFIAANFKNKLANSELIDNALNEYKNYRSRLYQKFLNVDLKKDVSLTQRLSELSTCQKRLQQEYDLAEQTMRTYIRGTTNTKTTTALLEKLQGINGKLEGLNSLIGEMRGYFQIMADKVPYFVQTCLKQ